MRVRDVLSIAAVGVGIAAIIPTRSTSRIIAETGRAQADLLRAMIPPEHWRDEFVRTGDPAMLQRYLDSLK